MKVPGSGTGGISVPSLNWPNEGMSVSAPPDRLLQEYLILAVWLNQYADLENESPQGIPLYWDHSQSPLD